MKPPLSESHKSIGSQPVGDDPAFGSGSSRRAFLSSMAALGIGEGLPIGKMMGQGKPDRIDVHGHMTPPIVLQVMGAEELGNFAKWTPEIALAEMDKNGIATAMVSVPPHYDPKVVDKLARPSNEFAARLASDHKGRFGTFAFLPMPHVDATLKEIEYLFDTLKLDGVGMYTNYGDKWIGDATFDPVFEELNRRKAIVFTHPITANCCGNLLKGVGDGTIEWQTDTTRAIANMLFSGSIMRYPNVRVIFSHGGGTMPYLVERFTAAARGPKFKAQFPQGFAAEAAKLFYDTAWTSNPVAMGALSKVVPLSQIVFGTDYPARAMSDHVKGLAECGVFNARELQQVQRENALTLFPRFKS
jgi:predicted TIM-barrel fold metal-dependent hydrolase